MIDVDALREHSGLVCGYILCRGALEGFCDPQPGALGESVGGEPWS